MDKVHFQYRPVMYPRQEDDLLVFAEWEKACRGTDGRLYPWGDQWQPAWANLDPLAGQSVRVAASQEERNGMWDVAWATLRSTAAEPGAHGLHAVGSYPEGASPYGVFDMAGNAAEWVADWYSFADYSGLPDRNPFTSGPEWNRALWGSAW